MATTLKGTDPIHQRRYPSNLDFVSTGSYQRTAFRAHGNLATMILGMILGMIVGMMLLISPVHAQQSQNDWPRWRGPNQDDISPDTGLLDSWPEGGPERIWMNRNAGFGYAGFSIVGDQLFTMGQEQVDEGAQFVLCLNAETGEEIWRTRTGQGYANNWGGGPRSTPTVDGERVYALDARGQLVCLQKDSGQIVWQQSLTDFGGKVPQWGYSESLLVDGDQVVCTPGGGQGAIMAFDKSSGEPRWQCSELTTGAHYSSPVKAEIDGQDQYVQLLQNALVSVSSQGELLWKVDWSGRVAVIPSPIVRGNQVYVTSGYGVGSMKVSVENGNRVNEIWSNKKMKNHHGGVILVDGHVFGFSDGAGWVCQRWDSGDIAWNERNHLKKGTIGYADGKFVCVDESSGEVVMIKASSDGWNELGRFTLSPQTENRKPSGRIWVHPVIVDGKLYLRDQELIYCYRVK